MTTHRLIVTAFGGGLILFLLLSWLGAGEDGRLRRAAASRSAWMIERGAALYDGHCRSCHGVKGEGVGQLGPALSVEHFFTRRSEEVGWQATLADYIGTTTEHGRLMGTRPLYAGGGSSFVMPPWHRRYGGPLTGDEIAALTAFVLNWEATARGLVVLTELELPRTSLQDPATVADGAAVFRTQCSRCHRYRDLASTEVAGPDLTGLGTGAGSRREGLDPVAYIRESVLVPDAYRGEGYLELAERHPCGAELTETQLVEVCAYLLQEESR